MISKRKEYIIKIFLNKCNIQTAISNSLKFHLKLIENSNDILEEHIDQLKEKYTIDYYVKKLTPIVDKQFTIEEMQIVIKFYSSEVGMKMAAPNFLYEVGKIGEQMITEMEYDFSLKTGDN